jgi:hypothetical protein
LLRVGPGRPTCAPETDPAKEFDIKPFLWFYVNMKTTLDLPDELMRRVKIRAAERNQKLKDVLAELIQLGLAATSGRTGSTKPPKPARLRKQGRISIGDVEAAIASGRE